MFVNKLNLLSFLPSIVGGVFIACVFSGYDIYIFNSRIIYVIY